MDNVDREKFWNVLKDLHDNSEASVKALMDASPWPKTLCRFRSVGESTLQQLNDNKLFFSSADRYDDPFDTYFYINVDQMAPVYEEIKKNLYERKEELVVELSKIAILIGETPETFIDILTKESPDLAELKGQLKMVHNLIQRRLFSICFCEDPYNETLWLKYAGNYSGFVQVYDLENPDTFMCGKEDGCKNCMSAIQKPNIYPIYYSNEKHDATEYAMGMWLMEEIAKKNNAALAPFNYFLQNRFMWEAERISLIKKKCHENDYEWRMIRPQMIEQRSCIKMKPCKVIIGLRTPEYESRLIVSAAVNAGIQEIHKLFINDLDELKSEPVSKELYGI